METQGSQGEVVVRYEYQEEKGVTFHTGNVLPLIASIQHPDLCSLTSMLQTAVHRSKHAKQDKEMRLADDHSGMKITVKLFLAQTASSDHIKQACKSIMEALQVDYIDTFLLSMPDPSASLRSGCFQELWETMEMLEQEGVLRSIGVCGFSMQDLELLLSFAKRPPKANLVHASDLTPDVRKLITYARNLNISVLNEPRTERGGLHDLDTEIGLAGYSGATSLTATWAVRYTAAVKCRTLLSRKGYFIHFARKE